MVEAASVLLEAGANIEACCWSVKKWTPLFFACEVGASHTESKAVCQAAVYQVFMWHAFDVFRLMDVHLPMQPCESVMLWMQPNPGSTSSSGEATAAKGC